ncbi:MAG: hypothetical protein F7B17_04250 [Desulfurococcales archaeon]|nr:hypothetical protein [Desulfurococcales archaeon]
MELYLAVALLATSTLAGAIAGYVAGDMRARRVERVLSVLGLTAYAERRLARLYRKTASRPKRRYIVFEVLSEGPLESRVMEDALRREFAMLFGKTALAASGLSLVDFNPKTMRGVVRVRREFKVHALAAMGALRSVGNVRVMIVPIAVSGTLKRARRRMEKP